MESAADDRQILIELLTAAGQEGPLFEPGDETLCDYLSGRLSEAEAEGVRAWVAARPEAAERLLELEAFANPPAPSADVVDLEIRTAWHDFDRRIARGSFQDHPLPAARQPSVRSRPWLATLAAVFALATCGLTLRVWQLEEAARRPIANLRTLELLGEARSGAAASSFRIVSGEPFRVAIYPAGLPAGCAAYRAAIRDSGGVTVAAIADLRPDARGRLDLLLPGEAGARVLELSACGEQRGNYSFDLVTE